MKLINSLQAWGNNNFKNVLKDEIEKLDPTLLPLQQGLSHSSYVSDNPVSVTILNVTDNNESLTVKAGIFYKGIIAGCSCADDPTPQDEQTEYCEVEFTIDKNSAETTFTLLND